ncbi:MAG: phosphogluconate dehydrogenase (NAD(+)-dependent, decarboxylating) [Streptosporangiaceae bacterium]
MCSRAERPRAEEHQQQRGALAVQIGMVGLGRMGANMSERLRRAGHTVVGYDRAPDKRDVASLRELVAALATPRVVWVMVPSGDPTRETIDELGDLLAGGDLVVDGGNSHYVDDQENARWLGTRRVGFVDVGVSGGVWGLGEGYALMAGGDEAHVARLRPLFEALKPPGHDGFVHAGTVGAGHFTKMVHNGIEYGLMQAYAEGYELMAASELVEDIPAVVRSWHEGTVVRSWLLDLLVRALDEDPRLAGLRGYAADSGEGRWTVQAAVDHAVPMPVISAALFARFASRQDDSPAMKVVAALRQQFGGHAVTTTDAGG